MEGPWVLWGALGAGWGARKVLGCFGRSSEGASQTERSVGLLHPDPLGAGSRIPVSAWVGVGGGTSLRKRPSWEPRLRALGFVTISGELGHPQCCCTSPSSGLATQCPGAGTGLPTEGTRARRCPHTALHGDRALYASQSSTPARWGNRGCWLPCWPPGQRGKARAGRAGRCRPALCPRPLTLQEPQACSLSRRPPRRGPRGTRVDGSASPKSWVPCLVFGTCPRLLLGPQATFCPVP